MTNTETKTMTLTETFDASKLKYILDNWELIEPEIKNCHFERNGVTDKNTLMMICKSYLAKSRNGKVTTYYRQKHNQGRYFAAGAQSLQSISREIRHTIASEFYQDIDIENAHPRFLEWYCNKHNIPCPKLSDYINNRDAYFKHYADNHGLSRSEVKQIYLSLTNGGDKSLKALKEQPPAMINYQTEMKAVRKALIEKHPERWADHVEYKKQHGSTFNMDGSFINILMCDMENAVLMSIYESLGKPRDCVLCFDGIMVRRETDINLSFIEQYIKVHHKIDLKLTVKAMSEGLKLPADVPLYVDPVDIDNVVTDDNSASIKFRGDNIPITAELIKLMLSWTPYRRAKNASIDRLMNEVKAAAFLSKDESVSAEFLNEWLPAANNAGFVEEYDANTFKARYNNLFDVTTKTAGGLFTAWFISLTYDHSIDIDRFINPVPKIMDPHYHIYFNDCLSICKTYETQGEAMDAAKGFIKATVARIDGGKGVWITKEVDANGCLCFNMTNNWRNHVGSISWFDQKGKIHGCTMSGIIKGMAPEIAYRNFTFQPTPNGQFAPIPDNKFNTFTCFNTRPIPDEHLNGLRDVIKPIFDHIYDVLSASDPRVYEYICDWFAHVLQRPNVKTGTALVFQSDQGAGKNTITDFIVYDVIGRSHSQVTSSFDDVVGRFNCTLENKILTVCDEVGNFGGSYDTNDKMKSIITQAQQRIEKKGIDTYHINDFNNFIFQSNNEWPVRVETTDRRYMVNRCSNARIGDRAYFDGLHKLLKDKFTVDGVEYSTADIFLSVMLERDISGFRPQDFPITAYHHELKIRGLPNTHDFMIELCRDNVSEHTMFDDNKELHIHSNNLFAVYNTWCGENNDKAVSFRAFCLKLNKIIETKTIRLNRKLAKGISNTRNELITQISNFLSIPADVITG